MNFYMSKNSSLFVDWLIKTKSYETACFYTLSSFRSCTVLFLNAIYTKKILSKIWTNTKYSCLVYDLCFVIIDPKIFSYYRHIITNSGWYEQRAWNRDFFWLPTKFSKKTICRVCFSVPSDLKAITDIDVRNYLFLR